MAAARASLRQKLWSAPLAPFRLAPATSTRACFLSTANRPARTKRTIPDGCEPFFHRDGTLLTTQANLDFLREYDITHDNGEISETSGGGDKSIFGKFGVKVKTTPKHVISPYHIKFLDPRGHPLAAQHRERYAHKAQTQPLWIITTTVGGPKAVVRITAVRRIRAAVYMALQAMGYDKFGNGQRGTIKGTVWLNVVNPLQTVSSPDKETFGRTVVKMMEALQNSNNTGRAKGNEEGGQYSQDRRKGKMSQSQLGRETRGSNSRGSEGRSPRSRRTIQ